jgi:hypothetical protein
MYVNSRLAPRRRGSLGDVVRRPERHPHIEAAMQALNNAAVHLRSADHDFQGHRAAALSHAMHALEECRICLTVDAA